MDGGIDSSVKSDGGSGYLRAPGNYTEAPYSI